MIGDETYLNPEWPSSDVVALRTLVEQRLTAREIGDILGRSRNAVIGKLRRIGIPLFGAKTTCGMPRVRVKVIREPSVVREHKPVSAAAPEKRRNRSRPSRWDNPSTDPIIPANNGEGVTILELSRDACHTVIGSSRPQKGLPRYCGLPAWNGTAYCEDHFAIIHRPPQPRR